MASSWGWDYGFNGPPGPQGSVGPDGRTGDEGPTGPQGLEGSAVNTGATGPTGPFIGFNDMTPLSLIYAQTPTALTGTSAVFLASGDPSAYLIAQGGVQVGTGTTLVGLLPTELDMVNNGDTWLTISNSYQSVIASFGLPIITPIGLSISSPSATAPAFVVNTEQGFVGASTLLVKPPADTVALAVVGATGTVFMEVDTANAIVSLGHNQLITGNDYSFLFSDGSGGIPLMGGLGPAQGTSATYSATIASGGTTQLLASMLTSPADRELLLPSGVYTTTAWLTAVSANPVYFSVQFVAVDLDGTSNPVLIGKNNDPPTEITEPTTPTPFTYVTSVEEVYTLPTTRLLRADLIVVLTSLPTVLTLTTGDTTNSDVQGEAGGPILLLGDLRLLDNSYVTQVLIQTDIFGITDNYNNQMSSLSYVPHIGGGQGSVLVNNATTLLQNSFANFLVCQDPTGDPKVTIDSEGVMSIEGQNTTSISKLAVYTPAGDPAFGVSTLTGSEGFYSYEYGSNSLSTFSATGFNLYPVGGGAPWLSADSNTQTVTLTTPILPIQRVVVPTGTALTLVTTPLGSPQTWNETYYALTDPVFLGGTTATVLSAAFRRFDTYPVDTMYTFYGNDVNQVLNFDYRGAVYGTSGFIPYKTYLEVGNTYFNITVPSIKANILNTDNSSGGVGTVLYTLAEIDIYFLNY